MKLPSLPGSPDNVAAASAELVDDEPGAMEWEPVAVMADSTSNVLEGRSIIHIIEFSTSIFPLVYAFIYQHEIVCHY